MHTLHFLPGRQSQSVGTGSSIRYRPARTNTTRGTRTGPPGTLFADLAGLTLIAFDPISITVIILIVMGIALVACTLPAARAARANPIESLRYE
ncbi:hypothetical protein [Arthrobacter sp. Y81]|uniref:hypothetical protein n=1 Tax=Arthrobacter sp. Y81 TaxID=2058897 RepID=UPI0011AFF741|nr:hypothetical protein [Arthrobacter sp. Y81]